MKSRPRIKHLGIVSLPSPAGLSVGLAASTLKGRIGSWRSLDLCSDIAT